MPDPPTNDPSVPSAGTSPSKRTDQQHHGGGGLPSRNLNDNNTTKNNLGEWSSRYPVSHHHHHNASHLTTRRSLRRVTPTLLTLIAVLMRCYFFVGGGGGFGRTSFSSSSTSPGGAGGDKSSQSSSPSAGKVHHGRGAGGGGGVVGTHTPPALLPPPPPWEPYIPQAFHWLPTRCNDHSTLDDALHSQMCNASLLVNVTRRLFNATIPFTLPLPEYCDNADDYDTSSTTSTAGTPHQKQHQRRHNERCIYWKHGKYSRIVTHEELEIIYDDLKTRNAATPRDNRATVTKKAPPSWASSGSSQYPPLNPPACGTRDFFSSPITVHENAYVLQSEPHPKMPTSYPLTLTNQRCPKAVDYLGQLELMAIFSRHAWAGVNRTMPTKKATAAPSSSSSAASGGPTIIPTPPAGRGILYHGDSVVRQFYTQTINNIRGYKTVTDHAAFGDILYIAFRTRDVHLTIHADNVHSSAEVMPYCHILQTWFGYDFRLPDWQRPRSYAYGFPEMNCPPNAKPFTNEVPLFVLLYTWDISTGTFLPHLTRSRQRYETFLYERVHLRVGGYMFWMEDRLMSLNITESHPYVTYTTKRLEPWLRADRRRRTVWLTTPISSVNHSRRALFPSLTHRNQRMTRWVFGEEPQVAPRRDRPAPPLGGAGSVLSPFPAGSLRDQKQHDVHTPPVPTALPSSFNDHSSSSSPLLASKINASSSIILSTTPPSTSITNALESPPSSACGSAYGCPIPIEARDNRTVWRFETTYPLQSLQHHYNHLRDMRLDQQKQEGRQKSAFTEVLQQRPFRRADNQQHQEPYFQRYMLDWGGIVDVGGAAGVTHPGVHVGCGWPSHQPLRPERRETNFFLCRDPLNSAAIQWFANMLLSMPL